MATAQPEEAELEDLVEEAECKLYHVLLSFRKSLWFLSNIVTMMRSYLQRVEDYDKVILYTSKLYILLAIIINFRVT